jgi:hypothetical protein
LRKPGPTGRRLGATLPLRGSTQAADTVQMPRLHLHLAHSRAGEFFMHE